MTGPGLSRYRKSQAASCHAVRPLRRPAVPRCAGPAAGHLPDRLFGLRVLRLSCRASVRLWQAGWNRGTYDSASPLTHSGVRRFFCCNPAAFYRGARRVPPPTDEKEVIRMSEENKNSEFSFENESYRKTYWHT